MLGQLVNFLEDIRNIFLVWHGTERCLPILFTHLRIKCKQTLLRFVHANVESEKFLGITVSFPNYNHFVSLWREIFVAGNYYFRGDTENPRIVDAGSNIGISICFFKYLYPNATIIGFEPDPISFRYLKTNIEANNFKKVTIHNVALGSKGGIIEFYQQRGGKASQTNSVNPYFAGESALVVRVESGKLSAFIDNNVDLLKIDVEGAEYDIFQDLQENNKLRFVKRIFAELHYGRDFMLGDASFLLKVLEKAGFRYAITNTSFASHHLFVTDLRPRIYGFGLDAVRI